MKHAQRVEVEANQSLFQNLLNQSEDAFIAVRAQDGVVLFANDQAATFLGCPLEELIGRAVADFSTELQKDGWPAIAGRCRRSKPLRFETELATRDGQRLTVDVCVRYIASGDGDYIVGVVRDISHGKAIESALISSEHRFRTLVEHSLVGVYVIQQGKMRYANPQLAWLFGYEAGELINMPVSELVHPDDFAMVREKLRQRESGQLQKAHYGFRARRRNGSFFAVEVYGCTIEHEGEMATIGTLLDVTERKQVEEALRESEERLRLTLKAAQQGWYDLNVKTGEAKVSPEYAEILGYDPAVFSENLEKWIERMHPDDRTAVLSTFHAYIQGHVSEYRVEFRQKTRSGDWKWILSIGSIVERDDRGEAVRMLGTHRDITLRKRAELDVRKLNEELEARVLERTKQLQEANQELETFTYTVSHDLKAPLRGIEGYSRLLQEECADKLEGECGLFIDNIRSGVRQMNELIEDLLAYSRVERRTLKAIRLQVASLIEQIKLEKQAELDRLGILLTVNLPEGLTVQADFNGLMMVLRNLFDNALKFTRDAKPPMLEMGGAVEGNFCVLWLRDNGIGFDMKFHDRIFEIFQRLQRTEDYPGTGIGLTIVRKAVQRMGGRTWAESAPGQGATFYLELPR